jgi:ABC-type Na+ transport system ATPase subunit NatA
LGRFPRNPAMTLQIRGISKTYPNGVRALKDGTLTIPEGMYGLLGPNGAGKSTLMRILATLQEPDGGSVQLGEIDALNQKDEVRQTLGYLPQEFGVYPKVNAQDLLEHFAILKGIAGRRARQEAVEALLRQTNLWDIRKQKLGGYSGGMRQRFGVAVALLGNPKLMIATAKQTSAGAWQVMLDVRGRKVVVDEAGIETEVPMDDWVKVGVFGEGEPHMESRRIRSGRQTITLTAPRKPSRAGIDPENLLIDLDTENNIKGVKIED